MNGIQVRSYHLHEMFENTSMDVLDAYVDPINDTLDRYQIDTIKRAAMFLAQTGHESGGYRSTRITENLNYRVSALTSKFGSRISAADAARYGRNDSTGQKANQEAIANIIYGGEWGRRNLGNTQPGDGWKFRGRGLIQLTGRGNYQRFADHIGESLDYVVSYLETPEGAADAAGWFWQANSLNRYADSGDVEGCTRKINGGTFGIEEREDLYDKALSILRS